MARNRPKPAEIKPASSERPETPAMMVSENVISAKNSGAPKASATLARSPAKKMSARLEMKSAMQEA